MIIYKTYYFIPNINADLSALAFEDAFPNEPYELIPYNELDEKVPEDLDIPIVIANPLYPTSHRIRRPMCLASNVEYEKVDDLIKRVYRGEIECVNKAIQEMNQQAKEGYEESESVSLTDLMKGE